METAVKQSLRRILFVQPSHLIDNTEIWKSKFPWLPRMALPQIAALTPKEIETKIIDEYIEDINFNEDVDLVVISSTTLQAPRAYQISEEFRRRGKTTIMGGIHPSLLPDEAQPHVDSVFIGEVENLWNEILNDFKEGRLKPRYKNETPVDITNIPPPDYSTLSLDKYKIFFKSIQTTRGCPHNCGYCSVTQFFGRSYRHRDVNDIVREIEQSKGMDIFFVDDNIAANPKRAMELFKAITPLKISWASQCCMSIAYNDELLAAARESGCVNLMLGLESLSPKSLESVNKSINNVDDYFYVVDKLHKHSISVMGLMVFGFDHDNETVFEKTAQFMEDAKIDFPCYWILTPYPNTPLYHQLESEGRIIERDWSKYDCTHVVFQPKRMSPEMLEEGYHYAFKRAYSTQGIMKRLMPTSFPMFYRLIDGFPVICVLTYLFRQGAYKGYHPMSG